MSGEEAGRPPKHGWARMVPELHVTDIAASLDFWGAGLGFEIAYRRAEERFAYLERPEGAQIMLCQRHGRFETGPMERPLGGRASCCRSMSTTSVRSWRGCRRDPGRSTWSRARSDGGPATARPASASSSSRIPTVT